MMTTNKNQRTTHIDDVVRAGQASRVFSPIVRYASFSTIIYACILYFADENDEITHTYTPFRWAHLLAHSRVLLLLHIYLFCYFFAVLVGISFLRHTFILLFVSRKIMCRARKAKEMAAKDARATWKIFIDNA